MRNDNVLYLLYALYRFVHSLQQLQPHINRGGFYVVFVERALRASLEAVKS